MHKMDDVELEKLSCIGPVLQTRKTKWHTIDEDRPLDGYYDIPPARQGDTQTPVVWVKFRHRWLNEVVVSRGRFDHDGELGPRDSARSTTGT